MSTSSKDLSYGDKLKELFPKLLNEDNIWALICVGDNLDNPAMGWSGFSLVPVFQETAPLNLFFGHMSEKLMAYENIAPFQLATGVSQSEAFRILRDVVSPENHTPVIISANAHTWIKPILEHFSAQDTQPFTPVIICLRDFYSATREQILADGDNPFKLFQDAPKLNSKFGLYRIAEALNVKSQFTPTKAEQRAVLTAECVRRLWNAEYPSDCDDEV